MANPYPVFRDHSYSTFNELRRIVRVMMESTAKIDSHLQDPNCPIDIKEKLAHLKNDDDINAVLGNHHRIIECLEAGTSSLDRLILLTAFCGHRDIVIDLIQRGADVNTASRYCIMGGHLPLLFDLIKHDADEEHLVLDALVFFEEHPHILLGLLEKRGSTCLFHLERFARAAGFFDTHKSAAAFLSKITNLFIREIMAKAADLRDPENDQLVRLVPLLPVLDGMIRYDLDYAEALAWQQNPTLLPVLLLQAQGACGLQNDLWEKIACHLNPPGSAPLSVAQMHRVKIAIQNAYEPAWFNRLASQLERRLHGKAKAEHLRLATTIPDRIEVLCQQRWNHRVRSSFLPKSVRLTMIRYPTYCNGLTLKHWLVNCADFLEHRLSKKQRTLGMQLRNLIQSIPFPGESDNARQLAALLEQDHGQPQSVRGLLKNLPYWNDLMELFPAVSEYMNRDIESKKPIRWAC